MRRQPAFASQTPQKIPEGHFPIPCKARPDSSTVPPGNTARHLRAGACAYNLSSRGSHAMTYTKVGDTEWPTHDLSVVKGA